MKKRILSMLVVFVMALSMLTVTAAAANYGNANYLQQAGYFYTANGAKTYGWKVSVKNYRNGSATTAFTLWFPDPTYCGETFYGRAHYIAGENGTGDVVEQIRATYYVNGYNYGYYLWTLPTESKLEAEGIKANDGYVFDHFEITYWNRDSSSNAFTKKTENFYPGDVMPFDRNIEWKYNSTKGHLDITVVYAECTDHVDANDDGFCDSCNICLHTKDTNSDCIAEDCAHGTDCCPKHEHKDTNGDGFEDTTNECMHEKDADGYCTVENCAHPEECCPKEEPAPDAPSMQALRDMNLQVYINCGKNSSHSGSFALSDSRATGMKYSKVVKNDGTNAKFSVEEYPWQCYVSLDNAYWFELYKNTDAIKSVEARFATVNHVLADENQDVGFMVYGTENGDFWWYEQFTDAGNRFTLNVTHE